jgi:hypothetical protein
MLHWVLASLGKIGYLHGSLELFGTTVTMEPGLKVVPEDLPSLPSQLPAIVFLGIFVDSASRAC